MSLICHECESYVGPSEELPGKNCGIVYPTLLSLVYVPLEDDKKGCKIGYKLVYQESKTGLALCLRCIETGMPEKAGMPGGIETPKSDKNRVKDRFALLKEVYECYKAETKYKKLETQQRGRWIKLGADEDMAKNKAIDNYLKLVKKLIKKGIDKSCIYCSQDVQSTHRAPFFVVRLMDRVYCEDKLSGFTDEQNYSCSDLDTGRVSFKICFDDFRQNFPKSFEQISYDLRREENPHETQAPQELHISPEFEQAIEEEGGNIDSIVDKLQCDPKLNLVVVRGKGRKLDS